MSDRWFPLAGSSNEALLDRRRFLKGAAALGTASLAGCAGNEPIRPGNSTENGTETPEPEYELNYSITEEIDLSDLPIEELGSFDEIREEDYLELEATVYEVLGGERTEVEPDHLELTFENEHGNSNVELGPELDNAYKIACTEAHDGENTVTLQSEINGETLEDTATVEKILPGTFIADFENQTPYSFNTIPDWEDYFWTQREEYHQHVLEHAETDNIVERTQEQNEINFSRHGGGVDEISLEYSHGEDVWITSEFQDFDPEEDREEMLNDGMIAWLLDYPTSAPSTNANEMAHVQAELIMTHHDLSLREIVPFWVENYGHGTGNHYFPEDDTIITTDVLGYVDNPGNQPYAHRDEFATIPDYHTGRLDDYQITYSRKKNLGIRAYAGPATIPTESGVHIQDSTIEEGMNDMAAGSFEDQYLRAMKLTTAASYYGDQDYRAFSFKDGDRDHIILSTSDELVEKYREQVEEATWSDIEQTAH